MDDKIVKCPVCKGKGVLFDHVIGVLTLGLGYLMQLSDTFLREECGRCGGTGYIKVKTKDEDY